MHPARGGALWVAAVFTAALASCGHLSGGPVGDQGRAVPLPLLEEGFGGDAPASVSNDSVPTPPPRDTLPSGPSFLMPGAPDANVTIG